MEKRYQVFVSSTYEDLQAERQEVMHALLELDCIPAGMELFPAANEDQWTLIKRIISECDYYVVVVGGRYGSTGDDGVGFTEKEYRYALELGKPVIGFLHRNPQELPAKHTEKDADKTKNLAEFRDLVQKKVCQFWDSPSDLGSKVSRSLIKLIKQNPAVGWVRADQVPSADTAQEMLALRKRIDELEGELANSRTSAPKGTDELAQGEDSFEINFTFQRRNKGDVFSDEEETRGKISMSWNEIFYALSPRMMDETTDTQLENDLANTIDARLGDRLRQRFDGQDLTSFAVAAESFQTILVQFKALGLIIKSVRSRSVKDSSTYWTLTPYGDTIMTQLRAVRRPATTNA